MKKILLLICLLGSIIGWSQNIPKAPNPPKLVNDFTGKLTAEQVNQLEQKLVALDESTSNQIAIVIINSLDGYDIQEYATKLFREWGIGNKKNNNGVLILAALGDRKLRIEVGYGLEGAIPDITAGSIIRNTISPAFKQGRFYDGLNAATDDLAKAASGEYKIPREKKGKGKGTSGGSILGFIIILFVVLIIVGNSGRGGGGGMVSRRGYGNIAETLLWSSLLGGGNRGGGGGWSGGGDSGGFGGFGGGSSGGGGASGDW